MSRLASQPLLQFLVLGLILYALSVGIRGSGAAEDNRTIVVTATDVSRLDAGWRARYSRAPTEAELTALVTDYVREVALYRHALAMGLDQNDQNIQRMLGQKLQTLTQGLFELSLSPTDEELRAYFEANFERYRASDVITFTQVFVDPDKRGEATLEDAAGILVSLRSLAQPTEGIERYGDQFMLQSYYPQKDELEVRKLFGKGFTKSVFELEPGKWHGPVLSGYGVHLVYVRHLGKAAAPEYEMVLDEVRQQWMDAKRNELQQQYFDEVLSGYEVVFEDVPDEPLDGKPQTKADTAG